MPNRLREIQALGQAIWIDNLNRALVEDGGLRCLVDDDGLSGLTSNPTIFEKAIAGSNRYDEDFRSTVARERRPREVCFELAFGDVREAADMLRPVFDRTEGQDGYVSFELPPELADDAEGSVEQAKLLRERIDRANVLIKVPGTEQGVLAFEALTVAGHSINVTLLFAVQRYEEIAEAYLRGLEQRAARREPIDRIASVASFFVSRVDSKVDERLDELDRLELKGRAAVANARIAYQSFQRLFSGERWERLRARGANVQRPLWASTSTKNPEYPEMLYVDELIGPDTVNTMPHATLAATRERAKPARTLDRDPDEAVATMREIAEAGVDVDDIVLRQLVEEGVDAFAESFETLIDAIDEKTERMALAGS